MGIASYHHNSNNHGGVEIRNGFGNGAQSGAASANQSNSGSTGNLTLPHRHHVLSTSSHHIPMRMSADFAHNEREREREQKSQWQHHQVQLREHHQQREITVTNENNNITKYNAQSANNSGSEGLAPLSLVPLREPKDNNSSGGKDLPTPTSTPTTSRKSRRRSNLFIPSSSKKDKEKNGEVGIGRSIPIKQGYLYKRSSKSLNKEWKKKYVTLCDDGRLTYHPSLHDYMEDVHGKEIPLQYVTVKVPGQKPRGSKSIITNSALTASSISNGM